MSANSSCLGYVVAVRCLQAAALIVADSNTGALCRSVVQCMVDQQAEGRVTPGGAVSKPDRRSECKASMGLGHSNARWSSINVKLMQLRLAGQSPLEPTSSAWAEVSLHAGQDLNMMMVLCSSSEQHEFVFLVQVFQLTGC